MLFSIVNNPEISANELNHELKVISQWAYQWKMKFNPDLNKQATELLFSCKKNSPNHPSLFFNESVVQKINEQKHLGLILDSKLCFERHVNEKIIKAKTGIGIIKYLSKFLKLRYLFQLRVRLSPLRSHKMRHNFCDTPSETCECNLGIEDIRHFLFECPFYVIQRVTLAFNVIDILQRKNLNHIGN